MAEFILEYHGGRQPETPEEGAAHRERWEAWITGLGETIVNPGTPLGPRKTVSPEGVSDGGNAGSMIGFSVVKADSLDAAVDIAKSCPFLEIGTVEVAEMMKM